MKHTVDGFIFVGTNFRGLTQNEIFVGSKLVDIVFWFMIHIENYHFVGTGIRGLNPPRKSPKIDTPRNLSNPQYLAWMSPCDLTTGESERSQVGGNFFLDM